MDVELVQVAEIMYLHERMSFRKIASILGSSNMTVRRQLLRRGVKPRRPGGDNGCGKNFKGGRRVDDDGYVWVRAWMMPEARGLVVAHNGYMAEHRAVMAIALKRPLRKGEQVHHKDGNRENNLFDNLQLRVTHHGPGVVLCCADCGSKNILGEAI